MRWFGAQYRYERYTTISLRIQGRTRGARCRHCHHPVKGGDPVRRTEAKRKDAGRNDRPQQRRRRHPRRPPTAESDQPSSGRHGQLRPTVHESVAQHGRLGESDECGAECGRHPKWGRERRSTLLKLETSLARIYSGSNRDLIACTHWT